MAATALRIVTRLAGLTLLVLGSLFWSGRALSLIPIHMLLGLVLVVALWTLAAFALRSGVARPLAATALVWGVLVVGLGFAQVQLLPGIAHWAVQVIHLFLGLGAIGQAEGLGRALASRDGIGARPAIA